MVIAAFLNQVPPMVKLPKEAASRMLKPSSPQGGQLVGAATMVLLANPGIGLARKFWRKPSFVNEPELTCKSAVFIFKKPELVNEPLLLMNLPTEVTAQTSFKKVPELKIPAEAGGNVEAIF